MLKELYIKDFTLIDQLEVEFHAGFSTITGETGAGKSIILGALGLLLGNRADVKQVREGTSRCVIEGHFALSDSESSSAQGFRELFEENDIDYSEDDCILRREINANGKSRAFVNDSPVSLSLLKTLGEQLIDIHSQHQNLLLQKDDFQLSVVDTMGELRQSRVQEFREAFGRFLKVSRELQEMRERIDREQQNADFLRYQFEELDRMNLNEEEDSLLEEKSSLMQHSEDIKAALYTASEGLSGEAGGALSLLHQSISALDGISKVYPLTEELSQRMHTCEIELKDVSMELRDRLDGIDYNPQDLERINQRLDQIYSLMKKHHKETVGELICLRNELQLTLDGVENSELVISEFEKKVALAKSEAEKIAAELTAKRKAAGKLVSREMLSRLKDLGLPNIRFEVDVQPKPLSWDGADRVQFLFSANPGTPLRPVSEIASGGEIARVMLSLKAMLSGAVKLPTIIFDEIDTGVSGRIADQMALIMSDMGQHERQVISITHLPQIAARGKHQYKVVKQQLKDSTRTLMKELSPEERIQEIAQMMSGSSITDTALANARTLLGFV